MLRVHRLDQINAKKPAKLLNSKSLTLCFSRQQIWPVFFPLAGHCSPACISPHIFAHTEQIQLQLFALRTSGARKSCATIQWIDIRVPYQCRAQMRSAAFLFACATGLALVAPLLSGDDDPSQYDPAAATTRQDEIDSSRPRSDCNKSRSMSCANVSTHSKTFYKEYTPLARWLRRRSRLRLQHSIQPEPHSAAPLR